MAWEEKKWGWCWGAPCQGWRGQKGGQAADSVSGLRRRRIIPLPGAEDSVWGEAGNLWDRRREACLGNRHLLHCMGHVDPTVFSARSLAERPWL